MDGVDFTRQDVEATLEVSPWELRDAFTAEIDPDSMAETAALYARAAGEAEGAGDLAAAAARAGEEAGRLDGASLVDGRERIDASERDLHGNGAELDRVTGLLVRAMNRALDAVDEVNGPMDGPDGLDAYLAAQVEQARQELADTPLLESNPYDGDLLTPGTGGALSRTALIRLRHLTAVADRARETAGDMTEAITQYRRRLLEYGEELSDADYDITEGPLGLWTTGGMAEFAAGQVARELDSGHPDPEVLARYTETLETIGLRLYDPITGLPLSGVRLTAGELAYLERFYAALGADDLAALGALAGGPLALDPARRDPLTDALTRVADGIVMLTDPAVGGSPDRMPAAVSAYLDVADDPAPARNTDGLTPERFEDFGRLMAAASHEPGTELGRELAAQRTVRALWAAQDTTLVEFDGEMLGDPEARAAREEELRRAFAAMDPAARAEFWAAHRDALVDAGLFAAPLDRHWAEAAGPYDVQEPLVRDYGLEGELSAGATVADVFGYDHAARMLNHYLDGSGKPVGVDVDDMLKVSPVVNQAVERAVAENREEWVRQATEAFRANGGRPVSVPVRSGAAGFEFDDQDWYLALAHAELDVAGVVVVEPGADGRPEARLDYQVNVWDRYNWDDGKVAEFGPITIHSHDIGRLHSTGLAQDFDVRGSSSVRQSPLPLDGDD
ncbi:hypothetical protein [Streptomyces sp. RFCAC02]|uniref:TPR repeat region-containing protein n=1 Tax=Streptomyces sp. RFCAC02 TaxID=2499143 RepID=UPI001021787F|nr:hypothetical protein [Streptomyces sp. RFCAC02]